MQQNNKTQSELKTGTIHKYFDRNILTPQKLLNYLKVDETFLNHLAGINLKLFKDYVNENREYNITNLYK